MTNEKLIRLFQFYGGEIAKSGVKSRQLNNPDESSKTITLTDQLEHLLYMCQTAIGFVQEGRTEKAFRWLGFIQGVLWKQRTYTLTELKNHSRPDETLNKG